MWIYKNCTTQSLAKWTMTARATLLFCKEAFTCYAPIENHHYPSGKDTIRGGRIATRQIFSDCYAAEGLAKYYDVEDHCLHGDKSYFPICKSCLKDGVSSTFRKGGRPNQMQAIAEKYRKKGQRKSAYKKSREGK